MILIIGLATQQYICNVIKINSTFTSCTIKVHTD